MTTPEQAAILEAISAANPDEPGSLMRELGARGVGHAVRAAGMIVKCERCGRLYEPLGQQDRCPHYHHSLVSAFGGGERAWR